ncbi:unnamed protein product [Urochloa humidicola]
MGKAARWFRSFLGSKKQPEQPNKDQRPPPPPPPSAKRWSFGKSSRDTAEAAAAAAVPAGAGNAAIARAAEAAWLRSAAYAETDREREQSKHAIAVAAATAAAADAAVAAAQAAVAVVRLTSKGRPAPVLATAAGGRAAAAVRIQTAFRGFLAKKALRALKALVKLQALVRGYLVRRQAAATLHSMQALVRAQATARARRAGAGIPVLPHLHHPPVRPRYSLQERYADETRSEHGGAAAYGSRRLSASVESSSYGYDRSPKIVEVDPGRPKSRSSTSRRASSPLLVDGGGSGSGGEEWCANSACSPLPCYVPPRIAVPTSRQFPDHDWCAPEKARPATAQSTPRYHLHVNVNAPATPTKSASEYSPSLHGCAPNYMSSTQASEAKSRSQSEPKQRPELAGGGGSARKRVPLSEVVVVESSRASLSGVVGMQRGCRAQEAFSFKSAVVGRIDRTLEVAGVENDRLAFLQRRW